MFLRCSARKKDGKEHRYFSIVENKRVEDGRVVQRHVLYLGEINSSQELAWRKSIEVFEDGKEQPSTLSLFAADRCEAVIADESMVRVRLSELRLCRPRQWGACWLVVKLWRELELDRFWGERLSPSRKGTRWDQVLLVLVAYRLHPAASGGYIGNGSVAPPWPICWARTSAWRSPISFMPVMIICWSTNRLYSITW